MGKITKEVKIGVAFIAALSILYFGINFLKGINIFKPANTYVVTFDNVAGMLQSDPITINGLKIGQVHAMQLNPQNAKNVLVHIQMDKGVLISKGSTLSLDASVLGGVTLILEPNPDSHEYYVPGDTLLGGRKSGMMDVVASVVPKVEDLLPKLDSILSGVDALVNKSNLSGTLENVNSMTEDFAKTSKEINILLTTINKDLPAISKKMENTVGNFEQMSYQVKEIDLAKTFNKLDSTMTNIQHLSSKLASKDSSLGLLLNDRQMYDSLNVAVGNASLLLKDVRENPSRYINVKVF